MSVWRAVKLLLTLRCDQSTRLMSESTQRELTRVERWAVRLHQLSCSYCRKVANQLRLVDEVARARARQPAAMPGDARDRIAASLPDERNRGG